MKKSNRVYGVVGIRSLMSNWNADFNGKPKTTSNGDIFGSDKAFKYPIKKMWEAEGEKVLYVKSYKFEKSDNKKDNSEINLKSKTLEEKFEEIFNSNLEKISNQEEIVKYLFSAIDVKNFGVTFTPRKEDKNVEGKNNISITGAVQVGQGFNKYKDTTIEIIDILSPFPSNKDVGNTSIGKKIVSDEAHYMYPFSVNPENYDIYTKEIEGIEGYTQEAYEKFKKGCLVAATAYNTNSKAGCENEFALFVECKDGSKLYLANLDQYIDFIKQTENKDIIDLSKLSEILSEEKVKTEIEKVEVYYNPYTTELKGVIPEYQVNSLI